MNGFAVRVPTPNVSVVDLVVNVAKDTTVEEVNAMMKAAAEGPMKGILQYVDEDLVSVDFMQNNHSSCFDSKMTHMIGKRMIKILSWYDNEWAYSVRLGDLIKYMDKQK
jgi:glyceraldehyde 3-phosphate dehydrogenase